MPDQRGFTLIELMVAIAIIALLTAAGLPAYQTYLTRAALTEMLNGFAHQRHAVELCALLQGGITTCSTGKQGIPPLQTSRFIGSGEVRRGVITLTGREKLHGLVVTLTPHFVPRNGQFTWQRHCAVSGDDALRTACEALFQFEDTTTKEIH